MGKFYLDIETTGLDFKQDQIITIQLAGIDNINKKFWNKFILKNLDDNEQKIVSDFWEIYRKNTSNSIFGFVTVGYNLQFDLTFLWVKAQKYGIDTGFKTFEDLIFKIPSIDLRQSVIMMKQGEFKGTALSKITSKKDDGNVILKYYSQNEWDKINDYIMDEMNAFEKFYFEMLEHMPTILPKIQK